MPEDRDQFLARAEALGVFDDMNEAPLVDIGYHESGDAYGIYQLPAWLEERLAHQHAHPELAHSARPRRSRADRERIQVMIETEDRIDRSIDHPETRVRRPRH